jgi:hypothetical protein
MDCQFLRFDVALTNAALAAQVAFTVCATVSSIDHTFSKHFELDDILFTRVAHCELQVALASMTAVHALNSASEVASTVSSQWIALSSHKATYVGSKVCRTHGVTFRPSKGDKL